MIGSIAQDSKCHERFVEIVSGFKRANGTIHACVKNDKGERYRVTLFANGTSACRHEVSGKHEGCPSRSHGCYHVQAVRKIASLFTAEGYMSKEQAPRSMQYYYFDDPTPEYSVVKEAVEVVAHAELGDVYERHPLSERGAISSNRGFSFWR